MVVSVIEYRSMYTENWFMSNFFMMNVVWPSLNGARYNGHAKAWN